MAIVGQREILTQQGVIAFFRDALGYMYLGHWKDRPGNSNEKVGDGRIEEQKLALAGMRRDVLFPSPDSSEPGVNRMWVS